MRRAWRGSRAQDPAYDYLRTEILSRRFVSGRLLKEQLAKNVHMSSLREALLRLELEGLVIVRPRRGYVVSSLDRNEIEDMFECRALLEAGAGRLAAKRRTEWDVDDLAILLTNVERVAGEKPLDILKYQSANMAFHDRLFNTSGRKQLCKTIRLLRDNTERFIRISVSIAPSLEPALAEHRAILSAFEQGNVDETDRLCKLHCQQAAARLILNLDTHVGS